MMISTASVKAGWLWYVSDAQFLLKLYYHYQQIIQQHFHRGQICGAVGGVQHLFVMFIFTGASLRH